jgi:hypothetical protein
MNDAEKQDTANGKQKKPKNKIGALDFETDPFRKGYAVEPFAWGVLYEDGTYYDGWGDDCVESLADHLRDCDPCLLYAHNGGRFDFLFMSKFLDQDATIFDGRIVRCKSGNAELRDSYLILPHALSEIGVKLFTDYRKFARGKRELHKKSIMKYLKQDCQTLLDQVLTYRSRFGDSLTVASSSTKLLNKIHKENYGRAIARLSLNEDAYFRKFYFAGRNETFELGILNDNWKMFDVRSMFPAVMRDEKHPTGAEYLTGTDLNEQTDLIHFRGYSRGALPVRTPNGGVEFPTGTSDFFVSGYELRKALALGQVSIQRVYNAIEFTRRERFREFVDTVGEERMVAIRNGHQADAGNLKQALVRAYGKQAINLDKLSSWKILPPLSEIEPALVKELEEEGWQPSVPGDRASFWCRPAGLIEKLRAVRHVALAASITGAARARLMDALSLCDRPIYCDTDGIICRELHLPVGEEIGQWRLIDQGIEAAIAAKKCYVLSDEAGARRWASKGNDLAPADIKRLAEGAVIKWHASKPTFSIRTMNTYLSREFKGSKLLRSAAA